MSDYLLYNGNFTNSAEPIITADNRGLRYGDGLFETLRVTGQKIHFMDWHVERLFKGLRLLQFESPAYFKSPYIASLVEALCKRNGHPSARIRITIVRGDGGLYDPEDHFPNCIIQSWPLPEKGYPLNETGLVTGIYRDAKKTIDGFSAIKSNNYLPYLMAALHAQKNQWNDALVLNSAGTLCDASTANVFIIKNETVTTCPLEDGCVAGIMRRFLLENLPINGFNIREKQVSVEDLLAADEVFLSNSIRGIRWVQRCEGVNYGNRLTTAIYDKLLKKLF